MPGGLLNIAATGNQNIIIHGNPTKTYFKSTYAKHTIKRFENVVERKEY